VTLKLRYGDFSTITRSRTVDRPTSSDEDIYAVGVQLMGDALEHDGRAVRLIGLGVTQLVEDAMQLDLFDPKRSANESLIKTIDRLRAKYGSRTVRTGQTFFDPFNDDEDWAEKRTGLSSQVGMDKRQATRD
jgi:DNA polymerase-4